MKNNKQNYSRSVIIGPSKDFESIKKIDKNGVEYWTARELMVVLGYILWQNFEAVIKKAQLGCINSRQFPQDHFIDINKMVGIGSKTSRKIKDYRLDRYACYLIAQNGDPAKKSIAVAQTYFAVQTRKQEIVNSLPESERRMIMISGLNVENSNLFSTAKRSGISKFGAFDDAGYQGLYNMPLSAIEKRKGIKKGKLMDYAGSEELGANMFRITQTEAKLKREGIQGDLQAQSVHFKVGARIRKTLEELGGEMPENLKPEKNIKQLKKEIKKLGTARKTLR